MKIYNQKPNIKVGEEVKSKLDKIGNKGQTYEEIINNLIERDKCSLCGEPIEGYGHNAEPLAKCNCCDDCNRGVILERVKRLKERLE